MLLLTKNLPVLAREAVDVTAPEANWAAMAALPTTTVFPRPPSSQFLMGAPQRKMVLVAKAVVSRRRLVGPVSFSPVRTAEPQ
jgi:hypothetical protein